MKAQPEPWLRGPIPEIPALLQPVAHALLHSKENITDTVGRLSDNQVWMPMKAAASIGFHLFHLTGSTDRLLTYARNEPLSHLQRDYLSKEKSIDAVPGSELIANWSHAVDTALNQLRNTSASTLTEERLVGGTRLPSTVGGLLFHAAEHAARHTGQIVTTAILVRDLTNHDDA